MSTSYWRSKFAPHSFDEAGFLLEFVKAINAIDDAWVRQSGKLEEWLDAFAGRLSQERLRAYDDILNSLVEAQHAHARVVSTLERLRKET
jgi:hypothetical protein